MFYVSTAHWFAQQTHRLVHPASFYHPGSPEFLLKKIWLFQGALQIKLISKLLEQ